MRVPRRYVNSSGQAKTDLHTVAQPLGTRTIDSFAGFLLQGRGLWGQRNRAPAPSSAHQRPSLQAPLLPTRCTRGKPGPDGWTALGLQLGAHENPG